MRITKARLRQIIREELELALEAEEDDKEEVEEGMYKRDDDKEDEEDAVNEAEKPAEEEEEDKELNERLRKALLKYLGN